MSALVLLSGGLDSTVALAAQPDARLALSINYSQRHFKELDAAAAVAAHYGVEHQVLDMSGWGELIPGSSLTDPHVDVPHGPYSAVNMASTVVPNRNATFLMAAAGIAAARKIDTVVTAVHSGDHELYADCTPEFIDAADRAAALGTSGTVRIDAPFRWMTKAAIVALAQQSGWEVPFELTWSCYEGGELHCGTCGTCVERREAFERAGVTDPTEYAA